MEPRSAPRDPRRGPREPKTAPRAAKSAPRARQEGAWRRTNRATKGFKSRPRLRGGSGSHFGAILEPFWLHFGASGGRFSSLRRLIFERLGIMCCIFFGSFVRKHFRAIQGAGAKRNLRQLRDDPHSNRLSARAQRACESPAAIVKYRRLAANDALASLAVLLLSVLVLRSFFFSNALAPLLPYAVLHALSFLALPVP